MILNNRRKFIVAAGLTVGGAALSGLGLPATAAELPAGGPERDVSNVISQYGRTIGMSGNKRQATEFKVKMRSIEEFAKAFDPQSLPFDRIRVSQGNVLTFQHRGVDFKIVNVA